MRSRVKLNLLLFLALSVALIFSCKRHDKVSPSRNYRMGFQHSTPKLDMNLSLQSLSLWTQRADAAIISIQVPWRQLYSGTTPQQYIADNFKSLVDYYRSKNFKLWIYIDPANGLDRSGDAGDLAALGKSIAQADVQALYAQFVLAMDSVLKPEHLGLALETNLIRGQSSAAIYQGVKNAANHTAATVRAFDKNVKLSVSIQADYAWGFGNGASFQGIDQDFADFPFIEELGLSSYPYFVFDKAQDIPDDYYSRIVQGHNVPVFISEGGWSSYTVDKYAETPQKQQDYITRQGQLLEKVNAIGYFQLLFCDIEPASLPPDVPPNINLFAYTGLADTLLKPKPGLTTWDNLFKKPLATGH